MLTPGERLKHNLELQEKFLDLIEFARLLRQTATDAETLLWSCLRDRRMNGRKFRRQHPIEPYVLDFYCYNLKLGIELDGSQHRTSEAIRHDTLRARILHQQGIQLLRFTNHDVLSNLEGVLKRIWSATDDRN